MKLLLESATRLIRLGGGPSHGVRFIAAENTPKDQQDGWGLLLFSAQAGRMRFSLTNKHLEIYDEVIPM